MEALNGVVSKTICCKPSTMVASRNHVSFPGLVNMNHRRLNPCVRSIGISNSRNSVGEIGNCGYQNKEHVEYYGESKTKGMEKEKRGWNRVSAKKKVKLLKGLVKDLSTFSELGYGLSFDCDDDCNQGLGVDGHDKSLVISQAADVLLTQLKQLKLEEEKQKKKEKEDKKKCKKGDCNSSSSSSESSDSECDKVVDMKSLRKIPAVQPIKPINDQIALNSEQDCSSMILEATLNKDASIEVLNSSSTKRIEVCMGGKCKKAGGPGLIEAFQKAVVGEGGEVVGCKCMGKCKSAPNVKVSNGVDLMSAAMNHVYVGVGLEDVDLIMASCFDEGSILSTAAVAS